jgi:hypothetical protein
MTKKSKGLCSVAVLFGFLFFPHDTSAAAGFAANAVMNGCHNWLSENGMDFDQGMCVGSIRAVIEVDSKICPPLGSKFEQAIRVVVTYIDKQPARLHEEFSSLAQEALREAFPCATTYAYTVITEDQVRDAIIQESRNLYYAIGHPCACPYDHARNGSMCGGRSAYSRPGGYEPKCYPSDVTSADIAAYRSNHAR